MLDLLLGSVKKNAERELLNYDPTDGTREKSFGDVIGDALTGRGSAIDKEVKRQYVQQLNDRFAGDITRLKGALPTLGGEELTNLAINENTNKKTLQQAIDRLNVRAADRKVAAQTAYGLGYGSEVKGKSEEEIYSFLKAEADKKEEEDRTRAKAEETERLGREERIRQENRGDLLSRQIASDELALLQAQNQAAASLRESQLQGRRLDMEQSRLNMQDARASRKDQQLALSTIIQGLAQMGQSITM